MEANSNFPALHARLQRLIKGLGTEIPETMGGFGKLHKNAVADGVLSKQTKELIALGIAIAGCCDGCIAYHVKDALAAGATRQEIIETVGVVVMMGGGPAVVYACQALEALDQFERESAEDKALPAL